MFSCIFFFFLRQMIIQWAAYTAIGILLLTVVRQCRAYDEYRIIVENDITEGDTASVSCSWSMDSNSSVARLEIGLDDETLFYQWTLISNPDPQPTAAFWWHERLQLNKVTCPNIRQACSVVMKIVNVICSDGQVYECRFHRIIGTPDEVVKKQKQLIIRSKPRTIPTLKTNMALTNGDYVVNVGDNITIVCSANVGTPNRGRILWTVSQNGHLEVLAPNDTRIKLTAVVPSLEQIDPECSERMQSIFTMKTMGKIQTLKITCFGDSRDFPRKDLTCKIPHLDICSSTGYIFVHNPLTNITVMVEPQDHAVYAFNDVNLTCWANGYPYPKLEWKKESNTSLKWPVVNGDGWAKIVMKHVSDTVSGTYICTGTNEIFEVQYTLSASYHLDIKRCSPSSTLTVAINITNAKVGETVQVLCTFNNICRHLVWEWTVGTGSGVFYFQTTTSDTPQERGLASSRTKIRTNKSKGRPSLEVLMEMANLTCEEDNMEFVCGAKYNGRYQIIGEVKSNAKVKLQVPLAKGDVSCFGQLESKISFPVTREYHFLVISCFVVGNASFAVPRVPCQNITQQHCFTTKEIEIHYSVSKETMLLTQSPESVNIGDTVTLHCKAEGHPAPTYTWHSVRNNPEPLLGTNDDTGGSILNLKYQTLTRDNLYRCTASNVVFGHTATASCETKINGETLASSSEAEDDKRTLIMGLLFAIPLVLAVLLLLSYRKICPETQLEQARMSAPSPVVQHSIASSDYSDGYEEEKGIQSSTDIRTDYSTSTPV